MMVLRYWFYTFCALAAIVGALMLFGALSGYDGPSVESCEQIDWQGRQCEALDQERARETLRQGASEGLFR